MHVAVGEREAFDLDDIRILYQGYCVSHDFDGRSIATDNSDL